MNDTIKQPFFEWTNSNLSKSISRYIWEMQGRKVHISLFCNFEVGEEMCLKSTIFKCLDSEVQVPPPLKVIRKLAEFQLSCNFILAWYKQTKKYHTTPIHFNENAKNWNSFWPWKTVGSTVIKTGKIVMKNLGMKWCAVNIWLDCWWDFR